MEFKYLSESYAAAPQIAPEDIAGLKSAGFGTVICNRPDNEVPPGLQSDDLAKACAAEGIDFVNNPLAPGMLTMDIVATQRAALTDVDAPVLAYCASGTRSAALWALAMAGARPADAILDATRAAGYALDGLRGQIEALAGQQDT